MSLLIDELMLECKRKGIKITQKDLAEAAEIGQTAIHKIIRGDTQAPKPQILVAIAECFTEALNRKITVDDLIAKESSPRATLATPRNPLKITNWMRLDEAEPVTDEDFIAVPVLGTSPAAIWIRWGKETSWVISMCTRTKLGGGGSFCVPEATRWRRLSSMEICC